MEPCDTDVQRRVISLCIASGRRSEAARRFAAFRAVLLRDFGIEPEFDLVELSTAAADSSHREPPQRNLREFAGS